MKPCTLKSWMAGALAAGALATVATLAAQAPRQGAPPVRIHGGINLVDIPVLVLDRRGHPVLGLRRSDFAIWDNQFRQRLTAFDNQPMPVSVALVVDTTDPAAVEQAHRSARLIASMIVGDAGRGSVFTAGYHTRQVLPFTGNRETIVKTLRQLKLGPHGNDITEALNLAILRLNHQPPRRTRAVVVITHQDANGGEFARAIVQASMSDATPIFRVVPNLNGPQPRNPISPEENGSGPGSNRVQHPAQPVGRAGNPLPCEGCTANLGAPLAAVLGSLVHLITRNHWNYVRATGGLDLHAGNNRDFDRRLDLIGNALRSFYHLYYQPSDLSSYPAAHAVQLRVLARPAPGKIAYRHTYVGARQQ